MKTIKVAKITRDSYNKLRKLGYKILFVVETLTPSVFAPKFKITKTIKCKNPKCHKNDKETGCEHKHSSACPKNYASIK